MCVRSTHNVALLNNKIYAVGGFDGQSGVPNTLSNETYSLFYFMKGIISAEVFDPENNSWNLISNMSCKRSSVGVVALDKYIYAIGGYCGDNRTCLDSIERYNPNLDKWSLMQKMSTKRSGPAVCVSRLVLSNIFI